MTNCSSWQHPVMKRNSSEEDTSVSKQKTKSNASLIKEK